MATLQREGDYWAVTVAGESVRLRDSKGLRYIATLVERPDTELSPLELIAAVEGRRGNPVAAAGADLPEGGTGDAGPVLDHAATSSYRERLNDLREEIDEARRWNDPEREARAREELEFIAQELGAAAGRGGRSRRTGSQAERARVNVTRAIRSAIEKLAEHLPEAARELDGAVRTGDRCSYRPGAADAFDFTVGGRERAAAPAGTPAQPPLPGDVLRAADRELVGRDEVLATLEREWGAAAEGSGRLVLVTGEAGIGKTRLVTELGKRLHETGVAVLFGRCDEDLLAPYQPVVEALRHYLRSNPAAAAESASPMLHRLVPELGPAGTGEEGGDDPDTERYVLFEEVAGLLREAAGVRPVVVIVDDIHWADRPTLLLLRHLQRSAAGLPIQYIATARADEPVWDEAESQVMASLRREERLLEVELEGLAYAETLELLETLGVEGIGADEAHALWERTSGNPFFARETARELAESGEGVPPSVREVLARRLGRLSAPARDGLTVGAAIGHAFDLALVERALPEADVVAALDEALAAGIVREQDGRCVFVHALMRDALYEELSDARRRRLHRTIGEALEASGAAERGDLSSLALHFLEAGSEVESEKIVRYSEAAARADLERLNYESAAAHYRNALEALPGDEDQQRRLELTMAMGNAEWRAGRLTHARDTHRSAVRLAREGSSPEQFAEAALGMGFGDGLAQWEAGLVDEEFVDALRDALDRLPERATSLRARTMAKLASALTFSDDLPAAVELGREAVALAATLDDPRSLGLVMLETHCVDMDPVRAAERIEATTEVLRLADQSGDTYLAAIATAWRAVHFQQAGTVEEFDAELALAGALADKLRMPTLQVIALTVEATQAQLEGRFDDAEALVQRYFELGVESYNASIAGQAGALLMMLRFEQARAEEILPFVDQFSGDVGEGVPWRHARLAVLTEVGRHDEARPLLEDFIRNDFAALRRDFTFSALAAWTAEPCAILGAPRCAEVLYDALLPIEDQRAVIWFTSAAGAVAGHLGTLAHLLGHLDRAVEHFERGLEINEQFRAWPYLALTQVRYADLLDELGEGARAAALRDSARAAAERRGLARVKRLLADSQPL